MLHRILVLTAAAAVQSSGLFQQLVRNTEAFRRLKLMGANNVSLLLLSKSMNVRHQYAIRVHEPTLTDAVSLSLIVHVLKFSRGAAIYLPAGPSGHIIFSNYDVVFSNCMEGGVYSFVIFLLGCYFVMFKVLYEIPTFTGSVGATPGAR